jgi:tetratricopeptide (TPR) repeat protein
MTEATNGGERAAPPAAHVILEEGIARYRDGDVREAHAHFERAHRRDPADPRTMSWYGVTLVLVEKNWSLGVLYCDQALRLTGPEPELFLNQARAHLALGQRERAVRAIARGLSANPHDPALKLAHSSMGWRRRPVLPCLPRSNPLNRWLGKLRHRWSGSRHHQGPTPLTLGFLSTGVEGSPPAG